MDDTPDILPITPLRTAGVLDDAELASLREATLTILEEVGVRGGSNDSFSLLAS